MGLNIGNVMKAMDEGKWIRIRNKAGEFSLKIKQMLPGEVFSFRKKAQEAEAAGADSNLGIFRIIAAHIVDWKDLIDAEGNDLPFNAGLLEDTKFIDALMNLSAPIPETPRMAAAVADPEATPAQAAAQAAIAQAIDAMKPKDGGLLFTYLSKLMARSDAFTEEKETDFLGNI
jgi:hypothetical protein